MDFEILLITLLHMDYEITETECLIFCEYILFVKNL